MIFTLEAVEAKHGDALLLHYGTKREPKLILVDGGPHGVWQGTLRPRLEALHAARGGAAPLILRLVLVSHIDEDHIIGVLELFRELADDDPGNVALPVRVAKLWHNAFDDLVARVGVAAAFAQVAARVSAAGLGGAHGLRFASREGEAIAASVGQGRELAGLAGKLGMTVNAPFTGLVAPDGDRARKVDMGAGLAFVVVGPRQAQLDKLQNEWAKQIEALRKRLAKKGKKLTPAALEAEAAAFTDTSITNLSSIVLLATAGRKRMLLTGDARGDFVVEGLRAGKLLVRGRCAVDLLKVPHHGSDRNIDKSFFEAIPARHYVISADGRFDNPAVATLRELFAARGNAAYTIHMTNRVRRVDNFLRGNKPSKVTIRYRADGSPSVAVDLGEAIGS